MSENQDNNYTTIKLPNAFVALIDELLAKKKLGFSSRTEVVKSAVRVYFQEMIVLFPKEESDIAMNKSAIESLHEKIQNAPSHAVKEKSP